MDNAAENNLNEILPEEALIDSETTGAENELPADTVDAPAGPGPDGGNESVFFEPDDQSDVDGEGPESLVVLRDRLLRLQADFDNYRKRVRRDEADRARRANENLIMELLPVLDHFEMGLKAAREAQVDQSVCTGLELVQSQLLDALRKAAVMPVESVGREFDPQCHDCVTHCPSEEYAGNMVIAESRRGYKLGDYLLRPAQVVVSSGPPADDDAPPGNEQSTNE